MGIARCEKCEEKKGERHKLYDKYRRDKDSSSFYNSKAWSVVRERIRGRDHRLCRLCLSKKKFKPMQIVHHIKELKDYPKLGLIDTNLISVCANCHKFIHKEYDKGPSNKKEMERELQALLKNVAS